MAETYN